MKKITPITEKRTVPVSVIIPFYRAEKTLRKTLQSVLEQTVRPQEIILINDASDDEGVILAEKIREENPEYTILLLHHDKNLGVSAARNSGIEKSSGDYIALLDSDDVWHPKKLEKQINLLENKNLNFDLLGTARNGKPLLWPYAVAKNKIARVTFRKQLIRSEIVSSSAVFRKEIFEQTGGFPSGQNHAEDVRFWLQALAKFNIGILNEDLVLCGEGKPTFGHSGLSSHLYKMYLGYCKNFDALQKDGRLTKTEVFLYKRFYYLKYLLLKVRTAWNRMK